MSLFIEFQKRYLDRSKKMPRLLEICLFLLNTAWYWQTLIAAGIRRGRTGIPFRLILVSPQQLKLGLRYDNPVYRNRFKLGSIVDGDWDLETWEVSNSIYFRMARAHFRDDIPWEKTDGYHTFVGHIEQGTARFNCRSKAEFDSRLARDENLFKTMAQDGYRTQRELKTNRLWDEVLVCIGRDGEIIFIDGRHRVVFAEILGMGKIPVLVAARHKKWHAFRQESRRKAGWGNFSHPDLE